MAGNKNSGRKGYGIENAKKHLLQQAYWIVNKKLEKEAKELSEKEKVEMAKQVVLKELGSKVDVTSGGDKLKVTPIYGGLSRHTSDTEDIHPKKEN